MVVAAKPRTKETQAKGVIPQIRDAITEVFLITDTGLYELGGQEAFDLAQMIEKDEIHSILEYRHYDDDKHTWAYWAVQDGNAIKPMPFPDLQQYSTTSPQLYTKAVVFPQIVARIVTKLKEVPPTLWDKMLKPTTIITAIVIIVLIMMITLVALSG